MICTRTNYVLLCMLFFTFSLNANPPLHPLRTTIKFCATVVLFSLATRQISSLLYPDTSQGICSQYLSDVLSEAFCLVGDPFLTGLFSGGTLVTGMWTMKDLASHLKADDDESLSHLIDKSTY